MKPNEKNMLSLKPREIIVELNGVKQKWKTYAHGVGVIHRVEAGEFSWSFIITLDNGIRVKCWAWNKHFEFEYFEEGDTIEFFGQVKTYNLGRFMYSVSYMSIFQAKCVSPKTRKYSEVFLYDVHLVEGGVTKIATNQKSERDSLDTIINCTIEDDIGETKNKWAYGRLYERWRKDIIFHIDRLFDC